MAKTEEDLFSKLLKHKEPSPELKAKVIENLKKDKDKFKEFDAKLEKAPKTREAFRKLFDGEMGKLIGS